MKPAPVDDKPMMLTFARLAFRYWPQTKDKGARDPFPKDIRALHGKKIIMDGFMFPIDFEKGKVRSFTLSNGMFGCCFGDAPSITETIKVYRADGKLMPYQSMARVTGILEVGEEFDADGYVDSVYRIKAEDVGAAQIGPRGLQGEHVTATDEQPAATLAHDRGSRSRLSPARCRRRRGDGRAWRRRRRPGSARAD